MERNRNYLYRVGKGNENSITELLCNLMRHKYIRDIILTGLGVEQINKIQYKDIKTQFKIDTIIPDIIIENNDVLIYIEVKINPVTPLQHSQKTIYLETINESEKGYKKIVFLIPENYRYEKDIDKLDNTIRVNWRELLEFIENNDIGKEESVISEILAYIKEKTVFKPININFSGEEIALFNNKDLHIAVKLLFKFDKLIEESKDEIINKLENRYALGKIENTEWGKGIWIYNENNSIFIGLNFNNEEYTYSVSLNKNNYNLDSITKKNDIYDNDEHYLIKIDKYTLCGEDETKSLFVKEVTEIINKYESYRINDI